MAKKNKKAGGEIRSSEDQQLGRILQSYELVDVITPPDGDPFVVVTDRAKSSPPPVVLSDKKGRPGDGKEIGTSSPSPFTAFTRKEYNTDLQGLKGLQTYDAMRKSDGIVRGTLRAVKTSVLAARWYMQPNSKAPEDVEAAEFAWWNLTKGMSISWTQVIAEATLCLDFGNYMFEVVWEERKVDGKDRLVVKKLAPRHPMDIKAWKFDRNGGPLGVWIYGDPGFVGPSTSNYIPGQSLYAGGESWEHSDAYWVGIENLLVFTFDKEAGNIEGISVLRSAYKHWYYKEQLYKIDAIQKERHGIGIPVIKLPMGFSPADRRDADELGRNLRTNERAHVVLPPNWDLLFAKVEGNLVDALKSVGVHDEAIRTNVLASFIDPNASDKEQGEAMFLKATRHIADIICDSFNLYLINKITEYNFATAKPGNLIAKRLGANVDIRVLTFALRNLVGAGLLTPDDPLESYLREEIELPEMDPTTARHPTDQNVEDDEPDDPADGPQENGKKQRNGRAGLPRQTPPSSTPPQKSGGQDKSGGK